MTHDDQQYWTYRAKLDRVVDGDTIDLKVDLGFRTYKEVRVRLEGVDTAEIYGVPKGSTEYKKGMEQKQYAMAYLSNHEGEWPLHFVSKEESGKYGRWIGDIRAPDQNKTLAEAIVAQWPEARY